MNQYKLNCILLVDDDEDDNLIHKDLIEELDITQHLQIATNGIEAMEYLSKVYTDPDPTRYPKPDLIFLDLNMPKMNGFEFLEEYERMLGMFDSDPKITVLTTSAVPEDRQRALEYPMVQGFELKPLMDKSVMHLVQASYPSLLYRA
jgi:CheY-like chemotaxis protein